MTTSEEPKEPAAEAPTPWDRLKPTPEGKYPQIVPADLREYVAEMQRLRALVLCALYFEAEGVTPRDIETRFILVRTRAGEEPTLRALRSLRGLGLVEGSSDSAPWWRLSRAGVLEAERIVMESQD